MKSLGIRIEREKDRHYIYKILNKLQKVSKRVSKISCFWGQNDKRWQTGWKEESRDLVWLSLIFSFYFSHLLANPESILKTHFSMMKRIKQKFWGWWWGLTYFKKKIDSLFLEEFFLANKLWKKCILQPQVKA